MLIASAVHFVTIPMWGALSDRIGRRPVYLLGAAGVGLWIFAFFPLHRHRELRGDHRSRSRSGCCFHGAMYGPQAAFFSELFAHQDALLRASRSAPSSPRSSPARLAPLIAVALLSDYDSAFRSCSTWPAPP